MKMYLKFKVQYIVEGPMPKKYKKNIKNCVSLFLPIYFKQK